MAQNPSNDLVVTQVCYLRRRRNCSSNVKARTCDGMIPNGCSSMMSRHVSLTTRREHFESGRILIPNRIGQGCKWRSLPGSVALKAEHPAVIHLRRVRLSRWVDQPDDLDVDTSEEHSRFRCLFEVLRSLNLPAVDAGGGISGQGRKGFDFPPGRILNLSGAGDLRPSFPVDGGGLSVGSKSSHGTSGRDTGIGRHDGGV